MINILVTGGNGQLASCIKDIEKSYNNLNLIYTDYLELDICNYEEVYAFFESTQLQYCINCAAYTAVDLAEKDYKKAYEINTVGAKNLALACESNNVTLIHVSTDFVFDGEKIEAYSEIDETNPISVYGETKLKGEAEIKKILRQYFIIRTSWLYSEHGNNFMKTMLKLSNSKDELSIVSDQIGTPTYATDLAKVIIKIINENFKDYGIYHYSNNGAISWFDFAKAIFKEANIQIKLNRIKTADYPTLAKRPMYSVLDKTKIKDVFDIEIQNWENSLIKALDNLLKKNSSYVEDK